MPKKILFPFMGDTVGGSHISDLELVKRLPRKEIEPVCFIQGDGALSKYMTQQNIPFIKDEFLPPRSFSSLMAQPFSFMKAVQRAIKFIKMHKIDAVYCADGPARYIWFYAAKLAHVRFILTQHALAYNSAEKKISYRFVDALICNSNFMRQNLPTRPRSNHVEICYPIVNICQKQAKRTARSTDNFTIGFIANIRPLKRPYIFLDIATQLCDKVPHIHFKMIGAIYGDEGDKIKAYIKEKGLEKHVTLMGFCQDVIAEMRQLDVIIAPAVGEAFGRVLVESALLKIPVIASDSGGHKEIIIDKKTGYLAKPDCVEDFVQKLQTLHADEAVYESISRAAYIHVRKNFSPDKQIEKLLGVIERIL